MLFGAAEIGARSGAVCHLGDPAYRHHRELAWDPARRRFVDAEANTWLDVPRRDPWQLRKI